MKKNDGMISLELSPDEAEEETIESQEMEKPKYPWGTTIMLNEEVLEMLGITAGDFEVGEELSLVAQAKVTGLSVREYEGGTHSCVDLQLTRLGTKDIVKSRGSALYDEKE